MPPPTPEFSFTLHHRDPSTRARLGTVTTPHGSFSTPAFMAVGTRGSIKGVTPQQTRDLGSQIILGNTYHLLLRPGPETVRTLGGLQNFSAWHGPMLTDSGGFQVFSLATLRTFDADGVTFKSHIDGAMVRLSPQESMRVQHLLGADIIMACDDCPPADCPPDRLAESLDRTHRWAKLCKTAHDQFTNDPTLLSSNSEFTIHHSEFAPQALFGIVQGGTNLQSRAHSAEVLGALDLPGYALGGLAVGEGHDRMITTIEHTAPLLPDAKPRYLMGVGYAKDILESVKRGIDMFDCVLPTRNGRNGLAFTYHGTMRLRNAKFANDNAPLEAACDCYCCQNFSRGYLRHLFNVEEMLGPTLLSIHNLRFFQRWMTDIRTAIQQNRLNSLIAPTEELAPDAQP
jgi:queuine tRNA-ribosyltransferase